MASRLKDKNGCEAAVTWQSGENVCNGAIGDNQTDCETKGDYTESTAPSCVEKSSSTASASSSQSKTTSKSNGVNLYFKFTLLLIIGLLF